MSALLALCLLVTTAAPPAKVRELAPIGDVPWCVEAYSSCTRGPDGKKACTSATLEIPCGETRPSPHAKSREQLRCVCK